MFAFNFDEAIRSFTRAAEIDPDCAMAWWGVSIASGPQYNHPVMTPQRTQRAWEGMENALARLENTTPVERALIEALNYRNAEAEPDDRTALNEAYAEAMGEIWAAHPDDADVGMLYAESMMVLNPWKLYTNDFTPHESTPRILATLDRVLELDPDHPGALHLYIHATEPSRDPNRGLAAADRLSDLVPASGHLLHMPSHIYLKTGFWARAVGQNEKAMAADKAYRALTVPPLAQHTYMTHNAHVRAYAAMMSGREQEAMLAARDMWANVDEDILRASGPRLDRWMCSVYDVQKRFGRWDAILAEPAPPSFMILTTATWRAARAIAYAAKKDFDSARREYDAFKSAMEAIPDDIEWGRDNARNVLEVSDHFIAGEIALQQGKWDEAAQLLEQAAAVEDTLGYGEPPQWLQPVRHTLGAVYLKAGRYADAERTYREDLAKWPKNGWSLFGLARSLQEQGKNEEAADVIAQYREAWKDADAPIDTSCKCIPAT
jgi:tetratricopeptide (TPR) repeat protein